MSEVKSANSEVPQVLARFQRLFVILQMEPDFPTFNQAIFTLRSYRIANCANWLHNSKHYSIQEAKHVRLCKESHRTSEG